MPRQEGTLGVKGLGAPTGLLGSRRRCGAPTAGHHSVPLCRRRMAHGNADDRGQGRGKRLQHVSRRRFHRQHGQSGRVWWQQQHQRARGACVHACRDSIAPASERGAVVATGHSALRRGRLHLHFPLPCLERDGPSPSPSFLSWRRADPGREPSFHVQTHLPVLQHRRRRHKLVFRLHLKPGTVLRGAWVGDTPAARGSHPRGEGLA